MTGETGMLAGETVYRVDWVLGTDRLLGTCHCGAEHACEDPVELWEWLLGHPAGHARPAGPAPVPHVGSPVAQPGIAS